MDGLTDSAKSSYGYRLTKLNTAKIYSQDHQFFSKGSSLSQVYLIFPVTLVSDSMSDLGEIRVYQRADFQSGSRVLKKVF